MEILTNINIEEAARYLGCRVNPIPSDILEKIELASLEIKKAANPRYIYRIFEILPDGNLQLDGTNFCLTGNDIKKHLDGCKSCVLMAATLGNEVDRLIRRFQVSDMAHAVVLDAVASSAIENVCNNIEMKIIEKLSEKLLYTTDRFSPGYGDMPLTLQNDFCRLLDTQRKIGLSVSEGGLLTPIKSVTAVIGISNKKQKKRTGGCETCSLKETCTFRKEGNTCGK